MQNGFQGRGAAKWQGWDLNQGSFVPEFMCLAAILCCHLILMTIFQQSHFEKYSSTEYSHRLNNWPPKQMIPINQVYLFGKKKNISIYWIPILFQQL